MGFMGRYRENMSDDYGFSFDMKNSTVKIPMPIPSTVRFSDNSLAIIITYCVCFIIGAVGNLTVLITMSRGRYRKSRISLMICHLSLADLIVTFFMIPIEIGWRITVEWLAGNMACKIFSFLRIFGLYLSSNILICISLDRYYAVLHPLKVNLARRRGKAILSIAWICSAMYASLQSFIFHVSTHRNNPNFQQCDTTGSFSSKFEESVYTLFCILAMYFIPLFIITWVYIRIFCEINNKTRDTISSSNSEGTSNNGPRNNGSRFRLRRSDMRSIVRARNRTLRMTIIIVAVFILCWTPYVFTVLWYIFDKENAELIDQRVQDGVYILVVANSCVNPTVYGSYAVDLRKECCRWFFFRNPRNNGLRESRLMRQDQLKRHQELPSSSMNGNNSFTCNASRVFRIFMKNNAESVNTTLRENPLRSETTSDIPERLPLHEMVNFLFR